MVQYSLTLRDRGLKHHSFLVLCGMEASFEHQTSSGTQNDLSKVEPWPKNTHRSLIHPSIHPSIHSFIHPFIYSFIHSLSFHMFHRMEASFEHQTSNGTSSSSLSSAEMLAAPHDVASTAHDWEDEKRRGKRFYDDGTMTFFW